MGRIFYASHQAKGTETIDSHPVIHNAGIKLWVDGVLNKHQRKHLSDCNNFAMGEQKEDYALCYFTQVPDGMALRSFLDPHVFVLQVDKECKTLEINFNPTPTQMMQLRKLHTVMKLNSL